MHPDLNAAIARISGMQPHRTTYTPLGGGSINKVFKLDDGLHPSLVVKVNKSSTFPRLFEMEAAGLTALKPYIRVPEVLGHEVVADHQILVMEHVGEAKTTTEFWEHFGFALARLHSVTHPLFGAEQNNYMGAVPQANDRKEDWCVFFADKRLIPLAQQCTAKNLLDYAELAQVEKLCAALPRFFPEVRPALVHGDLWSGNFLCGNGGAPVLIDPAVYFGHPAVDLGLTTLFGGFHKRFYEAYHYHSPLPANHREQWDLCNLYPLLIHLLLSGTGYRRQVLNILQRYAGGQQ